MCIRDSIYYFENSSVSSDVAFTILLNISITAPFTNITFSISPETAVLSQLSMDLYDADQNYIENLFITFGNDSEISLDIFLDYVGERINATGAEILGITVTVANWTANTRYEVTGTAISPEEAPESFKGLEYKNVTYETILGRNVGLDTFADQYFSDEGVLQVTFSNASATGEVTIIVFANATTFIKRNVFWAIVDNNATFDRLRLDLYNETGYIENLFLFAYDIPPSEIMETLDKGYMEGEVNDKQGTYIVIELTIGAWNGSITYHVNMSAWYSSPEVLEEYRPQYTYVQWDQNSWKYNDTWEWSWSTWEFGPMPKFLFYYDNGTEIGPDDFIPFDEWIVVKIVIPDTVFTGNSTLGHVELWMNAWMANLSLYGSISYDAEFNEFRWYSSVYNYSQVDPYATPHEFLTVDGDRSTYVTDGQYHNITFVFKLLGEYAIKGWYHFSFGVYDQYWNGINFGYSTWYTGNEMYKEYAVGAPPSELYSGYSVWFMQFLSLDREPIVSIPKGADFIIQINVSKTDLAYVAFSLELPYSVKEIVNVTDWHEEVVKQKGGWVYNKTSGTYYYNESAEVYVRRWVFGPHEVERYTYLDNWVEVNVTYIEYNYTTGESENYTTTTYVPLRAYYIYDFDTGQFETKIGYEVGTYVYNDAEGYWEWKYITEFMEPKSEIYLPFELDNASSHVYDDGSYYRVEFLGHFTDYVEEREYWIDPKVITTSGERLWYGGKWEEYNDRIAVGKMVLFAYIINDGKIWKKHLYATDPEEPIIVDVILNGPKDSIKDVDGLMFAFSTSTYDWNETMWKWSTLKTGFTYNLITGEFEYRTYNYTERSVYVYGPYWTWAEVNVTGYHWKYNPESGMWEWVNETYTEWRYVNVTGWHWEQQWYNHSSGEWVTEYIPMYSKLNEISVQYVNVTDVNVTLTEYKLIVEFNMTFLSNTPDADFYWEVNALNYTFGVDYSKPIDEYVITDWFRDVVYSYTNAYGTRIYATTPEDAYYIEYNSNKYPVIQTPYIEINGTKYPIKKVDYTDPWSGTTDYRILFGEYDPTINDYVMYYILLNGTKIYVHEGRQALIYNVTIMGTTYYTVMPYTRWDYTTDQYYFIDLDGARHYTDDYIYFRDYVYDSFEVEEGGLFMWINESTWVNTSTYIQWDYITDSYYVILENGTRLDLEYDDVYLYRYYFERNGTRYYVSWVNRYYYGEYNGTVYRVPEYWVESYFYTIINETLYEMPYDGAHATWRYQLERLSTDKNYYDAKVPVINGTIINDEYHEIVFNKTDLTWRLDNESGAVVIYGSGLMTKINGTSYWDLEFDGYHVAAGELSGDYYDEYAFNATCWFYVNVTSSWPDDWDRWPDPMDGPYYLLPLRDGSVIKWTNGTEDSYPDNSVLLVSKVRYVNYYDVVINGTHYAATSPYLLAEYDAYGNISYYYLELINDTEITFDYLPAIDSASKVTSKLQQDIYGYYVDFYGEKYYVDVDTYYDWFWVYFVENWSLVLLNPNIWDPSGSWTGFKVYNLTISSTESYLLTPYYEFIQKTYTYWGHPKGWMLMPIYVATFQFTHTVVVGSPRYGLWGIRLFEVDPETGALDLDGDLSTKDDQYYVRHVYWSQSKWSEKIDSMDVFIMWEPNATIPYNELNVHSWMGRGVFSWEYKWNETFYWYHASDFSLLNSTEMQEVYDTMWNPDDTPKAGYWDIAWMARNMSWADIVAEAEERGWDWITDNNVTWTWFWFGIEEGYYGTWLDDYGNVQSAWIGLRYEYAGMFIYNDTDDDGIMDVSSSGSGGEATHYFIPTRVGGITFTSPGAAYGNSEKHGAMRLPFDAEVTFGAEYTDINGTVIPFIGYSYWDWWSGVPTGEDFNDFDHRPTDVYIDNIMFLVHFQGNDTAIPLTENVSLTQASIKIDQHIGDWDVDYPGGKSVLTNRSLSVNWYVFADTAMYWQVEANGTAVDNNAIIESIAYEMKIANYKFAEIKMGETYLWGKNLTAPYEIASQTVPLGTFQSVYVSESSDKTVTGWAFSSTMYFLSVGFPHWDGYYVYNDPETIVYPGQNTNVEDNNPPIITNVYVIPENPDVGDDVKLRFEAWDEESGLKSVIVHFRIQGEEEWQTATVTQIGDRFFEAELGTFQSEVWVEFEIIAEDYAGYQTVYTGGFGVGGAGPGPAGPGGLLEEMPILLIVGGLLAVIVVIMAFIIARRRRKQNKF